MNRLKYTIIYIAIVFFSAGCSQQMLRATSDMDYGLGACRISISEIAAYPKNKKVIKVAKHNYKLFQKAKRRVAAYDRSIIESNQVKITECENIIGSFLDKLEDEEQEKTTAIKEKKLQKIKLEQQQTLNQKKEITDRALSKGYTSVHFTGISQFISSAINNPDRIKENWNHVFTLTNHDSMFAVSQIVNDVVVYQVDTSKVPYDLVNVIYPYGERLSDVVIIQPKHKDSQYFIGQKLGVNEKEKYFVFAGTKEYKTRLGDLNTAFTFQPAFD